MNTSNDRTSPKTWSEFFSTNFKSNPLSVSSTFGSDQFAHDVPIPDCTEAALTDPHGAFIAKLYGHDYPVILHNFTEARVSLGTKEYGCLQGNSNRALPIRLTPEDFFNLIPGSDSIDHKAMWEAKSETEFRTTPVLAGSESTSDMTDLRNAMYIPSQIAMYLLTTPPGSSAADIALRLIEIIKGINAANKDDSDDDDDDDDDDDTEIPSELIPLFHWLFHFEDNSIINNITTFHVTADAKLASALQDKQDKAFPATRDIPRTRAPRAPRATTTTATESNVPPIQHLEKFNEAMTETNFSLDSIAKSLEKGHQGSNKRGFDKLPNIIRKGLLAAGSEDGSTPAEDISSEGLEIFKGRSDMESRLLLSSALENRQLYWANLSIAQAKNISSGHWKWNGINPGGISMLLFSPYDPLSGADIAKESMVLQLKTKQCVDEISLAKLTETDVIIPCTSETMIQTLKLSQGLWDLFFPECLVSRQLENLVDSLNRIRALLDRLIGTDQKFITKLLCAVDSRVNDWIIQCHLKPESLSTIDSSMLNFDEIVKDIQRGCFEFSPLPPSIASLQDRSTSTPPKSTPNPAQNPLKRKREEQNRAIRNEEPLNPAWKLKSGESWSKVFCNTTAAKENKPEDLCPRWHIRGYCFHDCHRQHKEIPEGKKGIFDKYVKKCRREAEGA